jgi:hypothetical protein
VAVGSTSAPSTIKATDNSGIPVVMGVEPVRGRDRTTAPARTVVPEGDCSIKVTYSPRETVSQTGSMISSDNASGAARQLRRACICRDKAATPASVLQGRF